MFKYFFIFIFLISFSKSHASNKDKIIEKLQNTKNLVFEFEQNINGKIENGNCTIQYPKKIYCNYLNKKKVLVSNGKSLVIKTKVSFYRYPLNKTPLNLILDKNFLIENLNILPLICYEVIFTDLIQKSDKDTNLIINISEDGWFGKSIGPRQ